MNSFFVSWSPRILSVLRFITGFLILFHGTQKLFNFPPSKDGGGDLSGLTLLGGIIEFGGGLLVMCGLFTRWSAFLLSGTMAFAYWWFHGGRTFLPLSNGGDFAVLFCFVFFYLFFAGGGKWSLDNLIWKSE